MNSKVTSLTQFSSLAAGASSYTASVAAAASSAIRELAEQTAFIGDSVAIIASTVAPADKDAYWFYVEDTEEGES